MVFSGPTARSLAQPGHHRAAADRGNQHRRRLAPQRPPARPLQAEPQRCPDPSGSVTDRLTCRTIPLRPTIQVSPDTGHLAESGGSMTNGSRSGSFTAVSVPDGYDRFMLSQLFEPWAANLIARASLKPGCSCRRNAQGRPARRRRRDVDLGCRAPAGPVRADDRSAAGDRNGRAVPGGVRLRQLLSQRR